MKYGSRSQNCIIENTLEEELKGRRKRGRSETTVDYDTKRGESYDGMKMNTWNMQYV